MRGSALALCAAVLVLPHVASAEPKGKRNAIVHKPIALLSSGIAVEYERYLAERWSVLGGAGARRAAREDFDSYTLTLLSEGRFWLTRSDWASGYAGMAGPYLAFAFDAGRTSVRYVPSDRHVGAMWKLEESFRFGNRFVIWGLQEVSVALALDVMHEFDEKGRLAPNTQLTIGADLTVGWVF